MRFSLAALSALFCLISGAVLAGSQPVELAPISHVTASLVVVGNGTETTYSPAELEALGASRMVTVTPWREQAATFDGVLLTDILSANGLADVDAIRVRAENDYEVEIPAHVWRRWPILVATRVDGQPHRRRARGPIQFVLPMSDDAAAGKGEMENYWVWMAARIEPAD